MSIKAFIKAHCQKTLWQFTRAKYYFFRRKVTQLIVTAKARKYLPYYQDTLSHEILSDRLRYIGNLDKNIFLDRAEKTGIEFHDFTYLYPYSLELKHEGMYSGIVLIYDNKGKNFRYSRRLLSLSDWADKHRLMTLREFVKGGNIACSELIVPVLTPKGWMAFEKVRDIQADVYKEVLISERNDLQYLDVFEPAADEVIVDAGAYDCATALKFLEWGKGKVKHVYSFEFDPENAAKCEAAIKPYADKITLVKKGTWDKDEVIHIDATGGTGSSVRSIGSTAVHLTSIDNVVRDERVTFIKMDIEGAELKSLIGAHNTIIKNHPRLAICIYHKPEDLYEIPGYILSLVPEYKFVLRHYSSCNHETVLYAYCE